jgi:hypothetical protein
VRLRTPIVGERVKDGGVLSAAEERFERGSVIMNLPLREPVRSVHAAFSDAYCLVCVFFQASTSTYFVFACNPSSQSHTPFPYHGLAMGVVRFSRPSTPALTLLTRLAPAAARDASRRRVSTTSTAIDYLAYSEDPHNRIALPNFPAHDAIVRATALLRATTGVRLSFSTPPPLRTSPLWTSATPWLALSC